MPPSTPPKPLPIDKLYRRCDPAGLGFKTTAELEPLEQIIAQDRAMGAVAFGVEIDQPGYNIFVLGAPGTGKHSIVETFLRRHAAGRPLPHDWVYVQNFEDPHKPRAISLPCGQSIKFRLSMDHLVRELRAAIPAAFESDDYQERRRLLERDFKQEHESAFETLQADARAHNVGIMRSPEGFVFVPMANGEPIKPDLFQRMPQAEQDEFKAQIERLQARMEDIMRLAPGWQKELRAKLRALNDETTERVAKHLIDGVRAEFADLDEVQLYLGQVLADVVANAFDFLKAALDPLAGHGAGREPGPDGGGQPADGDGHEAMNQLVRGSNELTGGDEPVDFRRYRVNVLVHNHPDAVGQAKGAPVVAEDLPVMGNLLGRIEYAQRFGAMFTDFTLIKAGALHRANGGYLIVDARKILMQPLAWEELKRALFAKEIRIESMAQLAGLVSTVSLEPEPIPLDLKIVLVGDPMLYYLLSQHDPEFAQLFKVQAEFAEHCHRTDEHVALYARLIKTLAERESLCPLDKTGVARVIEHSSRLASDSERLSTRFSKIQDLLREADFWARKDGAKTIKAGHIQTAIDSQIHRSDRIRELMQEQITRGTVLIDTEDEQVGQVNGLAVLGVGNFAFGKPSRITARVRLGKGEVIDIERRVELGGALHSKGVFILTGYLGAKFGQDRPLALSASLVFEQSYGGVDGDSASSTELYALLSALADAPIKQGFAVTGSVNQYGQVQAIGGANEKIEGFFDICEARGLTGEQGVLIPAANVPHLMLRADVVAACKAGKFAIYSVETIDQGIEILTGVPAGAQAADGGYPDGTINARVAARLDAFAMAARRFFHPEKSDTAGDDA
jgi:predicted ATP-dependent protease